MTHILITGGTGELGKALSAQAREAGHSIRIMSRKPAPASLPAHTEWAQADVLTGQGLAEAVRGVDVIIHAASDPRNPKLTKVTEIDGTRQLIEAARAAGVPHLLYISIIGVDRVPYYYYTYKLAAEKIVAVSGMPYSILRIAQFHSFIDFILGTFLRYPIGVLPTGWQSQPIATVEAAQSVIAAAAQPPGGRLPEVGGPEVLTLGEMARDWQAVRGQRRLIVPIRLPLAFAEGFRKGYNTNPARKIGRQTWREWLEATYSTARIHDPRRDFRRA